ncbi:MAG: kelch repeat-containing protein [Polyangiales bacterium]
MSTGGAGAEASGAEASGTPIPTTILESSTPLMPQAVTSFGAASAGGVVYAFGGYHGTPHKYDREGQSGELWKLEATHGTFTLAATTDPVQGAALVATRDGVIRVGGMRAANARGEDEKLSSLDEVALYTPDSQAFSALPALPASRSSHAAALVGDTLFVVGGWQLSGGKNTGTFSDTAFALDLKTKSWRGIPQAFKRRALAAAALDGKLVAVGGMDESGKTSRQVDVLDPATGAFTRAADFPADAFGVAAASDGDTLYASGRDGTVYALKEPTGAWEPAGKLAFPRFFHQLVVRGDELVALGGISGMHGGPRIRQVEAVKIASLAAPRVATFVLKNPLRGRNRQGVFVAGDTLHVFGGNRSLGQHDFGPEDFVRDAARLELASLSWVTMAELPVARQTMQTLIDADEAHALVLGGFGHDGQAARAHADAFTYDVEKNAWSKDPGVLPTPRTQFGLTEVDGARWVFGGLDFKPEQAGEKQFDHPVTVLRGKAGEPLSDSGVKLPQPRRAFGGAQLDGKYYLVGGMAAGFSGVPTCDVFDFKASAWSTIACPKARISPQLVALEGKLYLAGGSSPDEKGALTPNRSLEVFDPKTGAWSTLLAELPIEARHLTMLPYANGLLLYSAHDEQGRVHVAIVRP